ncbi:MAG: two-component system response regulator [Geobacteraceae bacterium GWB2_52_12]|nr:MAG: two-component system response regulator [Geobacteraceae bacterium GWB2_52_12]
MKCLIAEDDLISRRILTELLSAFGSCDIAVNGKEAVDSFKLAHEAKRPYDVIFMDIMMPIVDGMEALLSIRALEKQMGIPYNLATKVVMTTALGDPHTVIKSFNTCEADAYIVKPLSRQKLEKELRALKLIGACPT